MISKEALRDSFASALAKGLLQRYQKVPSAGFVAKQFNLRANITQAITQESARRWLRGVAIPELDKLLILRSWLDLDLNALGIPSAESIKKENVELRGIALVNQKEFVEATLSITQLLHALMLEMEILQAKIDRKA